MPISVQAVLKAIDDVIAKHQQIRARSQYNDLCDQGEPCTTEILATMCATVERFAPRDSYYRDAMYASLKSMGETNSGNIPRIAGILKSLRDAYAAGNLQSIEDLVHADLFADFLEMADHLLMEGYKDPAAVIAGSVLEEHLRRLSEKHAIPLASGEKPTRADTLNSELARQHAYLKIDQKSVTAWLGLRNKAAHGEYTVYTKEQVALMIQGIRDFITRLPCSAQ